MGMVSLDLQDREAVAQLRALLRGEHTLDVAEEERLIAEFLAGRDGAASARGARPFPTRTSSLAGEILLHPAVVPAAAVAANWAPLLAFQVLMAEHMTYALQWRELVFAANSLIVVALGLVLALVFRSKELVPYAERVQRLSLAGLIATPIVGLVFFYAVGRNAAPALLITLLALLLAAGRAVHALAGRRTGSAGAARPGQGQARLLPGRE